MWCRDKLDIMTLRRSSVWYRGMALLWKRKRRVFSLRILATFIASDHPSVHNGPELTLRGTTNRGCYAGCLHRPPDLWPRLSGYHHGADSQDRCSDLRRCTDDRIGGPDAGR